MHSPGIVFFFFLCPLCAGYWSNACVRAFKPSALGLWNRAQMRSTPYGLFLEFSNEQIQGLSLLGVSGLSPTMAARINPERCAAFSPQQVAYWLDFFTIHICEKWNPDCMQKLPAKSYAGLRQQCTQRLRTDVMAALTAEQVSYIPANTFYILSKEQLGVLTPEACEGITGKQLAAMDIVTPSDRCSGFSSHCFKSISKEALSSISLTCLANVPAESLEALSEEQFLALPAAAFAGMKREFVEKYFTPEKCAQLGVERLNALAQQWPHEAPLGLSAECLQAVELDTCLDLSATFFNSFSGDHATQLSVLSSNCTLALDCDTVRELDASVIDAFDATVDERKELRNRCGVKPEAGSNGPNKWLFIAIAISVFAVGFIACIVASYKKKKERELAATNDRMANSDYRAV
jgi:hypothetical protein